MRKLAIIVIAVAFLTGFALADPGIPRFPRHRGS
jgi:hypothetical protein